MILTSNEILNELLEPLTKNKDNKKEIDIESYGDYQYNCWGFVAKLFNWTKNLIWVDQYAMKSYLEDYTQEIKKPRKGDIAVWENKDKEHWELIHTAIIIDPKDLTIIQKLGNCELEYGRYFKDNLYNYGSKVIYRRVK